MKKRLVVIVTCILLGLLTFALTHSAPVRDQKWYTVKLYTGEKVIESWTATSIGKMDGISLTFTVPRENFNLGYREVRICGVYTVEESY